VRTGRSRIVNIFLAIQNNTHADHCAGRFPELKFIVEDAAREATDGEFAEHGFRVRPADVDFVAGCVAHDGFESVAEWFKRTPEELRKEGFRVSPTDAATWEIAVAMDVEKVARNFRRIYGKAKL